MFCIYSALTNLLLLLASVNQFQLQKYKNIRVPPEKILYKITCFERNTSVWLGFSHISEGEAANTWQPLIWFNALFLFFFCFRMDDIQLCKDIVSLKQELREIVAVPGIYTRVYSQTANICFKVVLLHDTTQEP